MRKALLSAVGLLLAGAGVASAADVTYVVYPTATPTGYSSNGGPAGAFAFDGDVNRPGVSGTAPAGFGTSSFSGSVVNGGVPVNTSYTTFRVMFSGASALFGHAVTVGDLDALSFMSNVSGLNDWKVSIYTAPQATGNDGSFYHSRLQMMPLADNNGLWDKQTSAGTLWTDTILNGGVQTASTSYAAIQSGPVTIGSTTRDFRGETILWVDFSLGAKTGGGTESGAIDGIVFNLAGESVTLNLEASAPVPLPASAGMGVALLGALGLWRRGRASVA